MYNQHKLRGQRFYIDTLFGKYKPVTNNTCAQLLTNESFFAKAYQWKRISGWRGALSVYTRLWHAGETHV
jgi:hypothetical protein